MLRYFHTLRHLRPQQFGYRLWYRLWPPKVDLRPPPALRALAISWVIPIGKPVSRMATDRFRFLNQEHVVSSPADWNAPGRPKLWLYNLHYFDDLVAGDAATRRDQHLDLIKRWITENPPGHGNGWEPYPVSLRIVNWIKWALAGNDLPSPAVQSMAVQVRLLDGRLEYHLLGNHLWANAKALVFAGLFFDGVEARQWLQKGLALLGRQIPEQILADGGHFERSPMYHSIILEDLLDLVNLYRAYRLEVPAEWHDACRRMANWLKALCHPDGQIALFNDAALGIAPTLQQLEAYAERLELAGDAFSLGKVTHLIETGYIRVENAAAVLLVDAAPVGPDYIPGHGHADTLGFEFSLFGQRVLVDSGTSTYEKSAERQRQRSTAAHNTVQIDGEDSSEVWGGFRVARRARPFDLEVGEKFGEVRVRCAHDGYHRLPGKPTHRREWRLGDRWLCLRDTLAGVFREGVARYHFHPEVSLWMTGPAEGQGVLPGGQVFFFQVLQGGCRLTDTTWHPEFNTALANRCLEVTLRGNRATLLFTWG